MSFIFAPILAIYMTTIDKLKWRYATKKFDASKILSKEKLEILKEAFNLTATSFGLQTISLVVLKDKALRELLVDHSFKQRQILEASHLLVICIQDNILEDDVDQHFDNVKNIRNTPETILAPYRKDLKDMMKKMSIKERQEWSIKQAYIALGNLMTVCAMEGIDSCPMEGFIPSAYDDLLDLKAMNLKSVLLLPVGYRAADDMFADFKKVRKQVKTSVIEL
ncbi:NAD(P)H-dependent oxidoreductase [Psychroserpens sp. SPM9]|uniref:NAD(P)H-dependent oxidoreductase n=1 Tax=Psychroserpens sp. SPM9 TaxID=2975598 RepID=UPI0021A26198|nr:NAD(P)H-dependent oxidoreductase [Psychroserpens sp. SPM9]MDG5491213.1 NAD(P)H-dependent oxidoreductase [Psychroserpens sp. SPM9]